jgi:acyl-CoA hydrolase
MTGEVKHTTSAYLTFVAVDGKGGKISVAQLIPETEDEKRRYEQAGARRQYRLDMKNKLKAGDY